MLYMNFQSGWEPVLIHRVVIGFEAILESISYVVLKLWPHRAFNFFRIHKKTFKSIKSNIRFRFWNQYSMSINCIVTLHLLMFFCLNTLVCNLRFYGYCHPCFINFFSKSKLYILCLSIIITFLWVIFGYIYGVFLFR